MNKQNLLLFIVASIICSSFMINRSAQAVQVSSKSRTISADSVSVQMPSGPSLAGQNAVVSFKDAQGNIVQQNVPAIRKNKQLSEVVILRNGSVRPVYKGNIPAPVQNGMGSPASAASAASAASSAAAASAASAAAAAAAAA